MLLSHHQEEGRSPRDASCYYYSSSYYGRTYGSTRGTAASPSSISDEDFEDFLALASRKQQRQPPNRLSSLLWRALGSTGVLVLLAVGVSIANDQRTATGKLQLGAGRGGVSADRGEKAEIMLPAARVSGAHPRRSPSLTVAASNEYGEYSPVALAMYGFDMIVEPHRETTLVARGPAAPAPTLFRWRIVESDASGAPLANVEPVFKALGGREVVVKLTVPGHTYLLRVEELRADGAVRFRGDVVINCKYVRREIRDLTDADREEFLAALAVYYTASNDEGKALYGDDFFNYEHITAIHNSAHFCYHAGLQFLTAHFSFGLMMERSIQAVNPRVSLPVWDYFIDAETLGYDWEDSIIFADEMFGRTKGSPEESYQLTEGRFANVKTMFDPEGGLARNAIDTDHNAYGYVDGRFNYQDLPILTRTSTFCNLKSRIKLPTSDFLFKCFSDHGTLTDWESCIEFWLHSNTHNRMGGAFDCAVDMEGFHDEHAEYSAGLLTYLLMYLTSGYWSTNKLTPKLNECDTKCARGQAEKCGCTCTVDFFSLSDDEVYSLMSSFIEEASHSASGAGYISFDASMARPWGFQQGGVRLNDSSSMLILRVIAKIGCEPGAVGMLVSDASPMDPIFWLLHSMYEKALHVLWMSPIYRDRYAFEWTNGTCVGSKLHDKLPFTEKALGMGEGADFLTNAQLMKILYGGDQRLPYVYDKFSSWGNTDDFDFCPTCVETVLSTAGSDRR